MQNYDIVNTGREVLAQLITTFEQQLTAAVANVDKGTAMKVGDKLLEAYSDLDELVVTKSSLMHSRHAVERRNAIDQMLKRRAKS